MAVLQELDAPPIGWSAWDGGRMLVNDVFADLLTRHSLETFVSLSRHAGGTLVRAAGPRVTTRFELDAGDGSAPRSFYLKRHAPVALAQRLKPWLRLTPAVFGARPEWEAILKFHAAGVPTVTPVAFGSDEGHSWLLLAGLESSQDLLDLTQSNTDAEELRRWTRELAEIAARMHAAGLHHQDFYLNHVLLCPSESGTSELRVIDLGRAREQRPLNLRWILKDLSQLNYSARHLPCSVRLRFLRNYLGRPLNKSDRRMIWWLQRKAEQIARHSAKHGL